MSSNQPPDRRHSTRSPFDVIRHVDEDTERGEFEWWSAREAMPYLGYKNWQNMENVIAMQKPHAGIVVIRYTKTLLMPVKFPAREVQAAKTFK